MPSLVWSHLVDRSHDDQLAGEEADFLAHHFLLSHFFCAFVGSVISFADVVIVGDLQAPPGTRLLAPDPCFPQGEGKRFAALLSVASPADLPTRSEMLLEVVEQLCSLLAGRRGAKCSRRSSLRPGCSFLVARCSRGQHKVPSLVWSHLVDRSHDDQLAGEEADFLTHHFLLSHLFCAFVGSVISFADVVAVGDLQAPPVTRLLVLDLCFPQGEGKRFAEQVPP